MELTLPDQPPLLAGVLATLADPSADVQRMARSLSPTPELAHAFVRLANTFGRRGRVSCTTEAILELNPLASKQLILCLATKKHLSATSSHGFSMEAFWLSSLRRAFAAHVLGKRLGLANDLSLFSVGFHQDIGVLLRAQQHPTAAQALSDVADAPALSRLRVERRCGATHDLVGLTFCNNWSLATEIAVPIRYHHQPEQAPSAHAKQALIAHAAEPLADLATTSEISPVWALAERSLSALRLDAMLPMLFDQIADLVDDTAEAFGIDAAPEARFVEIRDRSEPRESGLRLSHGPARASEEPPGLSSQAPASQVVDCKAVPPRRKSGQR